MVKFPFSKCLSRSALTVTQQAVMFGTFLQKQDEFIYCMQTCEGHSRKALLIVLPNADFYIRCPCSTECNFHRRGACIRLYRNSHGEILEKNWEVTKSGLCLHLRRDNKTRKATGLQQPGALSVKKRGEVEGGLFWSWKWGCKGMSEAPESCTATKSCWKVFSSLNFCLAALSPIR